MIGDMRITKLLLAATTFSAAWGQPSNTVTASVSASVPVTAGTATFTVQFLDANLSSSVDTAVGVLSNSGITATNLMGVSVSLNQGFVITQYDFSLAVASSEYGATRDKLIAAQRAIANVQSQALSWRTAYAATSEATDQALQQALPGLLEKAKQQADVLAAAIGAKTTTVQSLTPTVSPNGLNVLVGLLVSYSTAAP